MWRMTQWTCEASKCLARVKPPKSPALSVIHGSSETVELLLMEPFLPDLQSELWTWLQEQTLFSNHHYFLLEAAQRAGKCTDEWQHLKGPQLRSAALVFLHGRALNMRREWNGQCRSRVNKEKCNSLETNMKEQIWKIVLLKLENWQKSWCTGLSTDPGLWI